MPAYKVYDENGRLISTLTSVLTPVKLTGVQTNSAANQNIITADDTASCFPGMPVQIPYIPQGAFIAAVLSSTQLLLAASTWDATNGRFTLTGDNAWATATASNLTGYAYGFSPFCVVHTMFPLGTWRNSISTQVATGQGGTTNYGASITASAEITAFTATVGTGGATPTYGIKSDEIAATPLKRHNGEPWGFHPVISSAGLLSFIPAKPGYQIVLSSVT